MKSWHRFIWLSLCGLALSACTGASLQISQHAKGPGLQTTGKPGAENEAQKSDCEKLEDPGNWGQFHGKVRVEFDDNGRDMVLLEDFKYTDPKQTTWRAPKGSRINGASIPQTFWAVIGGPFEGKYRDASVIHDVACAEKSQPWKDVHRTFYYGMRCRGVPEGKAKTMYFAVYRFGPRRGLGAIKAAMGMGPDAKSFTAKKVEEWCDSCNPTLEEIEKGATP